ncbi:MAG: hypothetical protein VB080_05925 [Propionicimonas sp.]|uniref:hypothetical protein n=1 Tax=Propionicimonas sp. TaxID=1955623 RepID=UPI002B20ED2F|nr:hypothetical protein [Propionicimonas sp.]MEA4943963.1 hypothetical protein [Propionicimonas sp.]MEA5052732.1 hypothetical protein [Propionicimonas sp.]MEA5117667.1 hypothetical protein [Propionicimonas sp.]
MRAWIRRSTGGLTAALGLVLLASCTPSPSTPTVEPTPPVTTAGPTTSPDLRTAPWARPISTGVEMWTTSKDGWTVTAYDMGRGEASQDSSVGEATTNQPLVRKGDPLAFVNLVATNTSDEVRYISIDEPDLWATPAAKLVKQGVVGVAPATDQQARDHGIWYHNYSDETREHYPFPLQPGESCALGAVLPLSFGTDYLFVPRLAAHADAETMLTTTVEFDQQTYTFES